MPIDFHAKQNRFSYAMREADATWKSLIQEIVDVRGKEVIDVGCGGGIYTLALVEMGAAHVTGIDFSQETVQAAQEQFRGLQNISFAVGDAMNTELQSERYDVVLERALIHHFKQEDLAACFAEALRLLKPGGVLIVQNRAPEDCLLPGSETHVRRYIVSRFPKLIEKDIARRHESPVVTAMLHQVGFQSVEERKLWETRQVYKGVDELAGDLLACTGRSILHGLTDAELHELVDDMRKELKQHEGQEIVEQDRWTVWSGVRRSVGANSLRPRLVCDRQRGRNELGPYKPQILNVV